ncbi:unnamed protein product, partial [Allacma fusca]
GERHTVVSVYCSNSRYGQESDGTALPWGKFDGRFCGIPLWAGKYLFQGLFLYKII